MRIQILKIGEAHARAEMEEVLPGFLIFDEFGLLDPAADRRGGDVVIIRADADRNLVVLKEIVVDRAAFPIGFKVIILPRTEGFVRFLDLKKIQIVVIVLIECGNGQGAGSRDHADGQKQSQQLFHNIALQTVQFSWIIWRYHTIFQ